MLVIGKVFNSFQKMKTFEKKYAVSFPGGWTYLSQLLSFPVWFRKDFCTYEKSLYLTGRVLFCWTDLINKPHVRLNLNLSYPYYWLHLCRKNNEQFHVLALGRPRTFKLRYLKNIFPNFYENLSAGTVFDAPSSPSISKWGTANSERYVFFW